MEEEWEWRVCELIDWSDKTWDCHLIDQLFHRDDAEAIKRIPLSRRNIPDRLFWLHTDKGEFSVKTGYRVARQLKKNEDMRGMSSQSGLKSLVWTKLWNLHIPNKIKVFGWRAFHNILPTQENLVQKHVIEDDTYELCTRTKETTIHAHWECGVAQGVWAESIRNCRKVLEDNLTSCS